MRGSLVGWVIAGYFNPASLVDVRFKLSGNFVEPFMLKRDSTIDQQTFIPMQISVHSKASQDEATQHNSVFH